MRRGDTNLVSTRRRRWSQACGRAGVRACAEAALAHACACVVVVVVVVVVHAPATSHVPMSLTQLATFKSTCTGQL